MQQTKRQVPSHIPLYDVNECCNVVLTFAYIQPYTLQRQTISEQGFVSQNLLTYENGLME